MIGLPADFRLSFFFDRDEDSVSCLRESPRNRMSHSFAIGHIIDPNRLLLPGQKDERIDPGKGDERWNGR